MHPLIQNLAESPQPSPYTLNLYLSCNPVALIFLNVTFAPNVSEKRIGAEREQGTEECSFFLEKMNTPPSPVHASFVKTAEFIA